MVMVVVAGLWNRVSSAGLDANPMPCTTRARLIECEIFPLLPVTTIVKFPVSVGETVSIASSDMPKRIRWFGFPVSIITLKLEGAVALSATIPVKPFMPVTWISNWAELRPPLGRVTFEVELGIITKSGLEPRKFRATNVVVTAAPPRSTEISRTHSGIGRFNT